MTARTLQIPAAAHIDRSNHDRFLSPLTLHPNAARGAIIRSIPSTGLAHLRNFFVDLRGRGFNPSLESGGFQDVFAGLERQRKWRRVEESKWLRAFAISEPDALVKAFVFEVI